MWTLDSEQAKQGRAPDLGALWGWVAAGLSGTSAPPPSSRGLLSLGCGDKTALCGSERTDGDSLLLQRLRGCAFSSPFILQEKQAITEQRGGGLLNKGQVSLGGWGPRFCCPHGEGDGGTGQTRVRGALDPKGGWRHPQGGSRA